MSVRRTFSHGQQGGWSAIALHLEAAESSKEGFYLTLFPDGKSPSVLFLRPAQVAQLLDMTASSTVTDVQLWDAVAKIPLEPLLPNRSLAGRLRALLVDQASAIRDQIRVQGERRPPPPAAIEGEGDAANQATELPEPSDLPGKPYSHT
jgi:hypothetical protein